LKNVKLGRAGSPCFAFAPLEVWDGDFRVSKGIFLHQSVMSRACASLPRYRIGMTITQRLAALVASALALAAADDAGAWKPRSEQARVPDKSTASVPAPQPTPDQAKASTQPPPVALTQGHPAVLASALVLAAAAAVGAWMLPAADSSAVPGQQKNRSLVPQPTALASSQLAACPLRPLTAVAGKKDGQFPLQAGVAGLVAADIASFIVVGQEAAASGRSRDAEVAFLMACQVADKLKGIDSVESAQARYELGSHYARLAQDGSPATAPNRDTLRSHAERLYLDSLHLYHFNYGQTREKPAFENQEPAPVQQTLAQGESLQSTPAPMLAMPAQDNAPGNVEPAKPPAKSTSKPPETAAAWAQPGRAAVRRAALPAPPRPVTAMQPRPSFDCSKARSVPERTICSDAELARLDRELGQVYARAKNLTTDRAAFQRQQDREWRMREALCRDRVCLLRWYAQRRYQLMAVIERREQPKPLAFRLGRLPDETAGLYKGH
jgi:hypothetical protein